MWLPPSLCGFLLLPRVLFQALENRTAIGGLPCHAVPNQ
jgi:hypothetical protein